MNWLNILSIALSALSSGTVAILHASGADKHKTIAGDVAKAFGVAAAVGQATHDALTSALPPTQATSTP